MTTDHDDRFGPLTGRPVSTNPGYPRLPPLWAVETGGRRQGRSQALEGIRKAYEQFGTPTDTGVASAAVLRAFADLDRGVELFPEAIAQFGAAGSWDGPRYVRSERQWAACAVNPFRTSPVPMDRRGFIDIDRARAEALAQTQATAVDAWAKALPTIAEVAQSVVSAITGLANTMTSAMQAFGRRVVSTTEALQRQGLIAPDPTNMMTGEKWRSPITGTQYRVAGKRGHRHWIESGPRRARWWR